MHRNKSYVNVVCLSKYLPVQVSCPLHIGWACLMHCGRNLCNLRCNSKTSMNFFSLLHSFTDRRFILTVDLSQLSIRFFFSPLLRTLFFSLKEALCSFSLAYVNCQHHYFCSLAPWLSQIRWLEHKHGDTTTPGQITQIGYEGTNRWDRWGWLKTSSCCSEQCTT